MSEKDFWLTIRQALLLMVSAIERKYLQRRYKHIELTGLRESVPADIAGVVYVEE